MQSDLHVLCRAAAADFAVPPFPVESIRSRISRPPGSEPRKRRFVAAVAASLSLVAAAATAAILTQSHIQITRSGGMVLNSQHASNRAIASNEDIARAAAHMNFSVTLPSGLPNGSKPIRLFVGDNDLMAITYDLPGAWRASRHLAWIFLTNPNVMSTSLPKTGYALRTDHRMSSAHWRVGEEQVIVVSNGLTAAEVARIKAAMQAR